MTNDLPILNRGHDWTAERDRFEQRITLALARVDALCDAMRILALKAQ